MYISIDSRRAPGRAPEMASAAITIGVYGVVDGNVGVVPADRVENRLALLAELPGELHADRRVAALHLVVHRLPDVVEEAGAPGDLPVEPELVGDHLADRNATSIEWRSTFWP
jgi:hypothetical protein